MRWGLVPSWAKDASIGNKLINARAETIAQKPATLTAKGDFVYAMDLTLSGGVITAK